MEEGKAEGIGGASGEKLNGIFIESNAIFDLAFERDRNVSYLVELAGKAKIALIVAEYALVEADGRSVSIIEARESRIREFDQFLGQLGRGAQYQSTVRAVREQLDALLSNCNQDRIRFKETLEDLRQICTVIPQTPQAHVNGELRFKSARPPFKPEDCQIYEAILEFVRTHQSEYQNLLFLTKDREDFDWQEIHDELTALNVEVYFSAGDCVRRLRELLGV
jgi:hypothetical protein